VTRNVDQIKDVIIYGQSIFENSENIVIRESNNLQLINFSPLRLNKWARSIKFYLLGYLWLSLRR